MGALMELATAPLYKLQRVALADASVAGECARRYADDNLGPRAEIGGAQHKKIAEAYLLGLRGEENPWRLGRGGNFARPLVRAWYAGKKVRIEIAGDVR